MAFDQANRFLNLSTPLGDNELVLTGFQGEESISDLFEFDLEMLSENVSIKPSDIVGKNITFSVARPDNSRRFFNGFVNRFRVGDEGDRQHRNYAATVVPWLWFLTRTADCRIFQEMSVTTIFETFFGDFGFSDFEIDVQGNHPTRDYCVIYRESYYQFFCRLCEEEGIFWFCKHEDGKHTLVLSDAATGYFTCDESTVDYPRDYGALDIEDHIRTWSHEYDFQTGKYAQTDYEFKTPGTDLMTNETTVIDQPGMSDFEIYDYPGLYMKKGDGTPLTRVRIEEQEAQYDIVRASSNCKTFAPGGKFEIGEHKSDSETGKTFVVKTIRHTAHEPMGYETSAEEGEVVYKNEFACFPDSVTFRPQRVTPKPFVRGVQTAVVVGPGGEEIYTDEFGRVKVQFHWDRVGENNENSSCWIRVAQNWAGEKWGIVFNPRIGQEVIVDFVEGDPDRPIITGRVYNAELMPPYTLPDEQTKSTIKTRSSKGGSDENFNEIRFEDKMGEEQLFIHAEKNQDIEVENDETHWVGHDRAKTIDRDETVKVGRDRTENVSDNERISIGNNRTESVGKNEEISIGGNRTLSVDKDETRTVGKSRTTSVGQDEKLNISGERQQAIGKDETIAVGGKRTTDVAQDDALQVGKKFTLVAGDQIQLMTGGASITMKKNGDIEIKGKDIKITGSGKINVKASGKVAVKGSKVDLN